MHTKTWLLSFFIFSFLLSLPIMIFNYYIDPLWTFSHSNQYNQNQEGFNERQLKTNKMYFNGLKQYNALLLGSSRSTYINQEDFQNMNVFNLAAADMLPYEYTNWIKIAEDIKQNNFEYIIIGIDFWASNQTIIKDKKQHNKTPDYYLNIAKEPFYRFTSLLSYSTYKKSIKNLKHNKHPSTIDYTRNNIKKTIILTKSRKKTIVQSQYKYYNETVYGKTYSYQKDWPEIMSQLKKRYSQSKFIIFTTPMSLELFKLLVKNGHYSDYEQWLRDAVNTFSQVHNFIGINTITNNNNNYPDLHHFYPSSGKLIAQEISPKTKVTSPKISTLVNKENIDEYLIQTKEQYKSFL